MISIQIFFIGTENNLQELLLQKHFFHKKTITNLTSYLCCAALTLTLHEYKSSYIIINIKPVLLVYNKYMQLGIIF